jgi:murein DD-endopeptidase MepM/ murein hydrolase activator NlpD
MRETTQLILPLGKITKRNISLKFNDQFTEKKRKEIIDWGRHMGVDIKASAGTKVFCIGRGTVVYSKIHPGEFSPEGKVQKRNWGGIVIIAHEKPKNKKIFYSLYGHLGKRFVKKGDSVEMGEMIGTIGKSMTESNGIWKEEHLHLAIYTGPFHDRVLPGYYKKENKITKILYWKDPLNFISRYNKKGSV